MGKEFELYIKVSTCMEKDKDKTMKDIINEIAGLFSKNCYLYHIKPAPYYIELTEELIKSKKEIPEYGDLMTMRKFIERVEDGLFIDYDGSGNLSDGESIFAISIEPSDIEYHTFDEKFTHVVWYNK